MATTTKKCTVTEYTLRLNTEEAQVLQAILNMIGGDCARYPRAVLENIRISLEGAGVEAASVTTERGKDCIYVA